MLHEPKCLNDVLNVRFKGKKLALLHENILKNYSNTTAYSDTLLMSSSKDNIFLATYPKLFLVGLLI